MKIKMLMMAAMMFLSTFAFALERQAPQLFNYQAALADEGGNLLSDGIIEAKFEILDASGEVVYAETQDVEVVKGNVSAMVGNGLDITNGAPTGGVPLSALDPTEARFLRVTAEGHSAYDPLEMVSVPYSMWSQMALAMPEGSITGTMIGKGVITKEHLDNELLESIYPDGLPRSLMPSDAVYKEDFTKFSDTIQSSGGAASVGVTADFIYSGSRTVQGVLKDIDLAVKKRNEEIEWAKADYEAKVGGEATTRSDADKALQNNINIEATARNSIDTALQNNINSEALSRQNAITEHASTASTHGVIGDIVGTDGEQTLTNKVLVAPVIVGGQNVNSDIGVDISTYANEGVVVEGNLTVKEDVPGNGKIKTKAVFNENATARLTPFAYGTALVPIEGSLQITNAYNARSDNSFNSRKVFFETPATDENYVVMIPPYLYTCGTGNYCVTAIGKKEVDGFTFGYVSYSKAGIDFVVFDDN